MFPFASQTPEQMFHAGQAALQAGDLDRARGLFEAVLREVPNEPATRYHLGVTFIRAGDPKAALPHFEKALALVPDNAEFWRATVETMARAQMRKQAQRLVKRARAARLPAALVAELGQLAAADHSAGITDLGGVPQAEAEAVTAALARGAVGAARAQAEAIAGAHPHSAFAHNLLGVAAAQSGDREAARAAFAAGMSLDPYFPEPGANLGRLLLEDGDPAGALSAFETALANAPAHVPARLGRGQALAALGRLDEALLAARRLLADAPESDDARRLLGQVQVALNQHASAVATLEAIAAPTDADRLALARARARAGQEDAAREGLHALVAAGALAPVPALELAGLLASQGRFEDARAVYADILAADPACAPAYEGLGRILRWQAGDPMIEAMRARAVDSDLPAEARAVIGFALAKAYEDTGEDAGVVPALDAANAALRSGFAHSSEVLRAETDALLKLFSAQTIERITRAGGIRDDLPIFVTGMPRSGSTLVEQIIARHPDVASAGELGAFVGPASELIHVGPTQIAGTERLTPAALRKVAKTCLDALRQRADGHAHVTDKMLNGFAHAPLIAAALPDARIVHVRRDPVDTCLSIYKNRFEPGQYQFAYDQREVAEAYVQYARVIAAWDERMPGRIIHVDYDALVADPETEGERLFASLGLDWSSDCLDPARGPRTIRTLSVYQARQRVHARSSGNWRRFADGLQPMLDVLREACLVDA